MVKSTAERIQERKERSWQFRLKHRFADLKERHQRHRKMKKAQKKAQKPTEPTHATNHQFWAARDRTKIYFPLLLGGLIGFLIWLCLACPVIDLTVHGTGNPTFAQVVSFIIIIGLCILLFRGILYLIELMHEDHPDADDDSSAPATTPISRP